MVLLPLAGTTQMHDWKLAFRKLRRRPVFALTTVACLALGIGATTAMAAVINTLFFQSASVRELHRLVFFTAMREGVEPFGVSPLEIEAFSERSRSFQNLGAAYTIPGNAVNLTGGDRPERVRAALASTAYFETLEVAPRRGRLFTDEEQRSNGPRAVLLGHALWTRMGAKSEIVGSELRVDGENRVVVGVLPPRFDLPSKTDLWLPLALDFERLSESERGQHSYMLVGRLADDVDASRAEEDLLSIARDLASEFPRTNAGWTVALVPFRDLLLGDVQGSLRVTLLVLVCAVSLLLIVACVNAAHLFLARCLEQERELALSVALGASRAGLGRQLFVESLLLSVIAGVLGSWIALSIVPFVLASSSIHDAAYTNVFRSVVIDSRVLLLALGASLLTAVLFGGLPLVAVLGRNLGQTLRNGLRGGEGRSAARWSRALVIAEVALSAMLLVSAGLLLRSLTRLTHMDLGFRPKGLLSVELTLPEAEFPRDEDRIRFEQRVLDRIGALPSIEAAGMTTDVPLKLGTWDSRYIVEGTPPPEPEATPWAAFRAVSAGYLETMGVRLERGRTFTPEDRRGAVKVAVVSKELARRAWGDENPLGHRIGHPSEIAEPSGWWTIVGVVADVKEDRYNFRIDRPVWYLPYDQVEDAGVLLNLVARPSIGGAPGAAPAIRNAVTELYPEVVPGEVLEIEPHVEGVVSSERTASIVVLLLAVLVTLLASIGFYGVMAYRVRQRFCELGLRLALGASPERLTRYVLGDAVKWTGAGLLAGFAGALVLGRFFSSLLFETEVWDPLTYSVVALLFLALALAACYLPARRAGATDPMESLRME